MNTNTTTGPQGHHQDGPSTLNNKAVCPGWTNDQTGDKSAAEEGTLLHAAAETGDLSKLTPEQAELVKVALGYIAPIEQGATVVLKEERLSVLRGRTWGTCDRIVSRVGKDGTPWVHVIDFKFGFHAQGDAETNLQGFAYLLGAADLFRNAQKFAVHFIYPKRHEVSRAVFTRADIPRIKLAVGTVLDRVNHYRRTKDETMLRPGVDNCLTCGGKASCTKVVGYALQVAKSYAPLEVLPNYHSSEVKDPAQMARLYSSAQLLEKIAESIKVHAKELANEVGDLVDEASGLRYTVATKQGSRVIPTHKLADAVDVFRSAGLSEQDLLACSSLSLTKALDLVEDRAPKGKKAKARGAVEALLSEKECVEEKPGSNYLKKVRISGLLSGDTE